MGAGRRVREPQGHANGRARARDGLRERPILTEVVADVRDLVEHDHGGRAGARDGLGERPVLLVVADVRDLVEHDHDGRAGEDCVRDW